MDAGVVVDLLEEVHFNQHVGVDGKIGPKYVPISGIVAVLQFPVEFLCDVGHYGVLGHCVEIGVLERLMTIFLRVLNLSIRSIFGLRIYTFS